MQRMSKRGRIRSRKVSTNRIIRSMVRSRLIWALAGCSALILAMVVVACNSLSARKPSPATPETTAQTTNALPVFSDWRAAYLGNDGRVHVVTLDGKTDVTGPELPDLTSDGLTFSSGGSSPNGHLLVYAPSSLDIVNLTDRQKDLEQERALAYGLFWSADSKELALDEDNGVIAIASVQNGASHVIQGMPKGTVGSLLGWIDKTHLAITDIQDQGLVTLPGGDQYNTAIGVASLDITTGQVRLIARISNPELGCQRMTLSPDGTTVLFSNAECHGFPFTPLVDEIDMATGAITPLPNILQATGAGFTSVAWQAGTDRVAVSTGYAANGDLHTWLLTLDQDRAQTLPGAGYAAGWAPGSDTLMLTTGQDISIGAGPFTLMALNVGVNGEASSIIPLTGEAMTFPFLGFVRTA